MLTIQEALNILPASLKNELVHSYTSICKNYAERKWEPSELNGGKFCEIVWSVLDGYARSDYPQRASKPRNLRDACLELEKNSALPRSFRILIPRLLSALYEIRSNRNVGHVGGDVDPNEMDSMAVVSIASWVMAEIVRVLHNVEIEKAKSIVSSLVEKRNPLVWETGGVRRVMVPQMKIRSQVLCLLNSSLMPMKFTELLKFTEYSNQGRFRKSILLDLHRKRLIEFDQKSDTVAISPIGIIEAEKITSEN